MAKHRRCLDLEEVMERIEEWESDNNDPEKVLINIITAWVCLRGEQRMNKAQILARVQWSVKSAFGEIAEAEATAP